MKNVNWDEVQEEIRKPVPGGYAAKIVNVEDVEDKEYLRIEWDFAEGEFKGVNQEAFDAFGFWPITLIRSYKETALRFFKGFKTCVEASNRNYVFRNDPKSLVGKYIGVVLGEEEYMNKKGEVKTRLYVAAVRSGKAIRDGDFTVPELKKLAPGAQVPASATTPSYPTAGSFAPIEDDDAQFPF